MTAPELDDAWFDKADLLDSRKLIRRAPITSARVRELSAKAAGGEWWVMAYYLSTGTPDEKVFGYLVHDDEMPTGVIDEREAPAGQDSLSHDLDLIAALCSEPARDRIAKALDLLERVEAGDAGLVAKVAMLLDHPSVYMGGPSAQSKRKAGYLLHELAALANRKEAHV